MVRTERGKLVFEVPKELQERFKQATEAEYATMSSVMKRLVVEYLRDRK